MRAFIIAGISISLMIAAVRIAVCHDLPYSLFSALSGYLFLKLYDAKVFK